MHPNVGQYYVSEIFQSIQGEGNFAGVNSLFIRFQFCNLTCSWCDTKYSWNENSGKYSIYSTDDLKKIIAEAPSHHIILTGGEPLLQKLDNLVVSGKKFHVETNGAVIPTEAINVQVGSKTLQRQAMEQLAIENFNFVVSPKLSNSRQNINAQAIHYWAKQNNCIFKFIVQTKDDIEEVSKFITTFNINKLKVYLGLEGYNLQSQLRPELVDEIVQKGFNFSPRLHILLWGIQRGK